MSTLKLDYCTEGKTADEFMESLDSLCTKYDCTISRLIPVGLGGGWPEIEFDGEREKLIELFIEFDGDCGNTPFIDGEYLEIT